MLLCQKLYNVHSSVVSFLLLLRLVLNFYRLFINIRYGLPFFFTYKIYFFDAKKKEIKLVRVYYCQLYELLLLYIQLVRAFAIFNLHFKNICD